MRLPIILVGNSTSATVEPIRSNLEKLGYTLHVAANAADALAQARQVQPVAFLVDVSTPDNNGIQVCGAIKAGDLSVPIIALDKKESSLRQAALQAGADKVMDHPVDWTAMNAWLSAKRSEENGVSPDSGLFMGRTRADVIGTTALLGHDLKSPVSMIISTMEVLISIYEGDENMANTVRLLRGALGAAYRQLNMISDWLDLARLEVNSYDLELENVDLAGLVREGLVAEDYALTTKKLRLEVEIPPDTPLMVRADPGLLRRVVIALVDNAIKFTVRDDLLRVSAKQDGDQVVLEFTDNGRPIFPGFEQQIAERAPQWEGRQSGTRTSVSMGLPFVRSVAVAHGGAFSAKSDQATGLTAFTFKLPALRQGENDG